MKTVLDHKYIAPECHDKGCQFLVLTGLTEVEHLREQQSHNAEIYRIAMALKLPATATIEQIVDEIKRLRSFWEGTFHPQGRSE